jgi:hypothetical protein
MHTILSQGQEGLYTILNRGQGGGLKKGSGRKKSQNKRQPPINVHNQELEISIYKEDPKKIDKSKV